MSHPACVVKCVAQALTSLSVCFTVSDVQLDASGLGDAISDFWENFPAVQARKPAHHSPLQRSKGAGVSPHTHTRDGLPAACPSFHLQAVKDAVDRVIQPIKDAIDAVKDFVDNLNEFVDGISIGRRLEEMTRARGLKEQAHRQLAEVRGRLLHAENEHARGGIKERLHLDINRGLEAHFTEPKQAARRRLEAGELITISNLIVSIPLNLTSRLLIEVKKMEEYEWNLVDVDKDFELSFPLGPTPFTIKLAVSFIAKLDLEVRFEGDFKALLNIVIIRMAVNFDLSTKDAGERAVFDKGDWTHNTA